MAFQLDLTTLVLLSFSPYIFFGIFFVWSLIKDRKKAWFLYFDSETNTRFIKQEPKDGRVILSNPNRVISLDKAKPLILKSRFGINPLYFVRWDYAQPYDIEWQAPKAEAGTKIARLLQK